MSATFHAETMWRRLSGLVADLLDHLRDLVDVPPVGCRPGAPLVAVDRAEVAVGVGPLVPDRDAAVLEPLHVGVAAQEPQQLGEHRPRVHLLGRHQREALAQVEAQLVPEDRQRAGAGAVALLHALVEDPLEEVEVGLHGPSLVAETDRPGDRSSWRPRRPRPSSPSRSTCTRPRRRARCPGTRRTTSAARVAGQPLADPGVEAAGDRVLGDPVPGAERTHLDGELAAVGGRRRRRRCRAVAAAQSGSSASTASASSSSTPTQPGPLSIHAESTTSIGSIRSARRSARGRPRRPRPERIRGGAANASRSPTRRAGSGPARPRTPARARPRRGTPPASSQACALPSVGWPANGSSPTGGEDPQPVVGGRVGRGEQERRLRQVGPAGERRHLLVRDPVGVVHHRDRVAEQRLAGEDVDLAERAHAGIAVSRAAGRSGPAAAGRDVGCGRRCRRRVREPVTGS